MGLASSRPQSCKPITFPSVYYLQQAQAASSSENDEFNHFWVGPVKQFILANIDFRARKLLFNDLESKSS